jgi:hypothetical protein
MNTQAAKNEKPAKEFDSAMHEKTSRGQGAPVDHHPERRQRLDLEEIPGGTYEGQNTAIEPTKRAGRRA